jgi:hypothetical protein
MPLPRTPAEIEAALAAWRKDGDRVMGIDLGAGDDSTVVWRLEPGFYGGRRGGKTRSNAFDGYREVEHFVVDELLREAAGLGILKDTFNLVRGADGVWRMPDVPDPRA